VLELWEQIKKEEELKKLKEVENTVDNKEGTAGDAS